MLNLVKAELYKCRKRAYTKIFLGVCAGIILLFTIMMSVVQSSMGFQVMTRSEILCVYTICLIFGMYLAIITTDMVFSEEYKHGTLKNSVAFGYTRGQIYFARLIAASIVMIVLALIIAVFCVVTCWIFFRPEDTDLAYTGYFFKAVGVLIPLWLSQVAICVALWFNIKNATFGAVVAFAYTAVLPTFLTMLYYITEKEIFCKIAELLPIKKAQAIQSLNDISQVSSLAGEFLVDGVCFFVIFALLGWLCFRKKEIK